MNRRREIPRLPLQRMVLFGCIAACAAWGSRVYADATAPAARPKPAETSAGETAAVPAPREYVLDLETAQRRALENNPSLLAVGEVVEQARQRIAQVRSLYFPQLQANYSLTKTWLADRIVEETQESLDTARDLVDQLYDQLPRGVVDSYRNATRETIAAARQARALRGRVRDVRGELDDAYDRVDEPLEGYQLGFTAGLLLFDGFAREFRHAMARFGRKESEAGRREAQRLILSATTEAFHSIQLARESLEIARADESFNTRLLEEARITYEAGKGSLSDLLNFRVRGQAARAAVLRAQADYESARVALAVLMAIPEGALPEHYTIAPLAAERPEDMQAPEPQAAIDYALAHRPELTGAEYRVKRAGAAVKEKYAAFSPEVALFATWQGSRTYEPDINADDFSTSIGVNVTYDVFTGGRRWSEVREAKQAKREAEYRMSDAELQTIGEVRRALIELETAQQELVLQRTAAEDVRRNRDLAEQAYRAGKAPLVRLNQAQRDLVEAQSRLALARVSLRRAWYTLRTATAQSLEPFLNDNEETAAD